MIQQPTKGHEVAGLPIRIDFPNACKPDDAQGLRKIVEAQAVELVKLRRALIASNSISTERLQIIQNLQCKYLDQEVQSNPQDTLEIINDLESDIYSIIKKSRWRKIGIMLGFVRRQEWEDQAWRSKHASSNNRLAAFHSASNYDPPLSSDLDDQDRLFKLWLQVSQSRWRRIGLKIGLAKELPLDVAHNGSFKHHAQFQLFKPKIDASTPLRRETKQASYEDFVHYTRGRFLDECQAFAVDAILDIGANTGQFASGIREAGYQGQIFSFEPLSTAHSKLLINAEEDMLWHVVDRCAVGSNNGSAKINIAGNSFSSSLLPMLSLHEEAAPESVYMDQEECSVITLDTFIEHTFSDRSMTFGLKIDTQGYEHRVIQGLRSCSENIKVIVCEMSLRPLYDDGISMPDLCRQLSSLGFRCVALGPEYEHPSTGELLQVDGVFARI
ncbi:FkbM family methyltransferase [Synechococcus sp. BA-132 BA5]|uniref:FkbM family methyltransferase n=1 Tax=Synechococcus sp. BA-132 BA5 TaxID=3110252 RepID=UPI002B2018C0|nr:FkbM family methyltransferase [Synechococcus sp. BA-132 BA5]MEA5417272.1 FkbM family methyltransferase [Synechococcus sp. BA-132 BA5]